MVNEHEKVGTVFNLVVLGSTFLLVATGSRESANQTNPVARVRGRYRHRGGRLPSPLTLVDTPKVRQPPAGAVHALPA